MFEISSSCLSGGQFLKRTLEWGVPPKVNALALNVDKMSKMVNLANIYHQLILDQYSLYSRVLATSEDLSLRQNT